MGYILTLHQTTVSQSNRISAAGTHEGRHTCPSLGPSYDQLRTSHLSSEYQLCQPRSQPHVIRRSVVTSRPNHSLSIYVVPRVLILKQILIAKFHPMRSCWQHGETMLEFLIAQALDQGVAPTGLKHFR